MRKLDSIKLSATQRRAVVKLAIELMKADDRIHSKEITILDRLQKTLGLSQEELDLTHYLSLEEAISCLNGLDAESIGAITETLGGIISADNDINFEETLLLSSISMSCGADSRGWCKVVSVFAPESEVPEKQIVFLESSISDAAHKVFDDKYDNLLISKAFGDIGIDFFYLPDEIREICGNITDDERFDLLKRSIEYIVPTGDKIRMNSLREALDSLDIRTFYHIILSRFNIAPESIPFPAFLMIRIRVSHVLDDNGGIRRMVDFLCIDISTEVKKRILSFVSRFGEKRGLLSYSGYHRFLFEYLSSESKTANPVTITDKGEFLLESGDEAIRFKSAPQAVTFYLLLLSRGRRGVSQTTFRQAEDFLKGMNINEYLTPAGDLELSHLTGDLTRKDDEYAHVILDTITIYITFSTKDSRKKSFLDYIQRIISHRSSLKTYINSGFASASRLATPEHFMIGFNPDLKTYTVSASPSLFITRLAGHSPVPLTEAPFWKSMKARCDFGSLI